MRIGIARSLDYWIGIPLCFIFTVFYKIKKRLIGKFPPQRQPRKILFIEFSEMGSAILAYSAMQKAEELYQNAELYFWIFHKNRESVYVLDMIPRKNVITARDDNLFILIADIIKNIIYIWKEKIDAAIDMELFSRFSSILTFLSGAKVKTGFNRFYLEGLYRGDLHTHKVNYNPYLHISKNFLSLVYSLKKNPKHIPLLKESLDNCVTSVPEVKSREEEKMRMLEKLQAINPQISLKSKIAILNPGINEILPLRKWPIENYIGLAKKLLEDKELFLVLIGTESQSEYGKMILGQISSPQILNLIGKTDIKEIICLFNISKVLISHDSGATNSASLTDIHIIVLFGPETPLLYAPLTHNKTVFYANFACSPCITAHNHRRSMCDDNKCLQAITVKEVYTAAKKFL